VRLRAASPTAEAAALAARRTTARDGVGLVVVGSDARAQAF
jgi:hypothetical protein